MPQPDSVSQALDVAYDSLIGLSVGDTFSEQLFRLLAHYKSPAEQRIIPPAPWHWTDDTNMALSMYVVINQTISWCDSGGYAASGSCDGGGTGGESCDN